MSRAIRRQRFMMGQHLTLLLVVALALTACAPFAPDERERDLIGLPDGYSASGEATAPARWWEDFSATELNTLIEKALGDNLTLHAAWARLDQARATARKAGADLVPSINAEADAGVSEKRSSGTTTGSESYSLGLAASYELDLWGRIRAERNAARLKAQASREDLAAAATTIAAEVSSRWLGIISQRAQLELLRQQLTTNRTYLELVELRFKNSLASALDIFQQRQLVERIEAQLPLVRQQEELLSQELNILLGTPPQSTLSITRKSLPQATPLPATGLPSQLLGQRPDIRAAFLRLAASDQTVSAARADRLPALSLTGSAKFDHDGLSKLFDNWLASLTGSLTTPIIDGGRRRAEVARSRAEMAENIALYKKTILSAMGEVEAALVREKKTREHITALSRQLDAARHALDQARSRYINGLNDYLPVLTQLLAVQGLEKDMIERQNDLLVVRVNLHRALGGTWTDTLARANDMQADKGTNP